mgnify:CR=1 FL=1
MDELNNHFVKSAEMRNFEIVSDGITGGFSEDYVAGMYVYIRNSFVNDGVYKVASVDGDKLTLDATLTPESKEDDIIVYGLTPPKGFVDLVNEIDSYNSGLTEKNIKSESQGDRSVTYNGDNTWRSVYSEELSRYRKMYNDLDVFINTDGYDYKINTKRYI